MGESRSQNECLQTLNQSRKEEKEGVMEEWWWLDV